MEEEMTAEEFVDKYGISLRCESISKRPDGLMSGGKYPMTMNHYKCRLARRREGARPKTMTVYYSMGSARWGPPTPEDVIHSMHLDSQGLDAARGDYEIWCDEYGFDCDDREAKKTFRAVEKQWDRLHNFFDDQDIWDDFLLNIVEE